MNDTDTNSIGLGLFLLRLGLGVFFLIWALEKLLIPDTANGIAGFFYGFKLPPLALTAVGIAQVAVVLAFLAGAFKTISYAIVTLSHAGSTLSTWFILIDPYGRTGSGIPHHLFLAAVPVLFACIALFLMRHHDTKFRLPLG